MACIASYTWCEWPPATPGEAEHLCPVHTRQLFREREEAKTALVNLLEIADDLRSYTSDWDWKYGEFWDAELKKAREAVEAKGTE